MASTANPIYYSSGYDNTQDPRKIAANNRLLVAQKGDILEQQAQDQYLSGMGKADETGGYLSGIESPLAQGQGGYNANELSQIQMTPAQQQDIVSRAGTQAGAATAAAADAAQRAANAAGGNPAAVAAYRARAAQQEGVQSADAATNARIGASNAAAQRAENVGQTRIGQQNQGLNYYQGVQQMQNQNAQQAANRQAGLYGTQVSGLNQSGNLGLQASQTPTTSDKIIGGIAGAASAFLDDGMAPGVHPAVVAEGGPEAVIKMAAGPYKFLEEGSGEAGDEGSAIPGSPTQSDDSWNKTPFWQQMKKNVMNSVANQQPGAASGAVRGQSSTWNPTTPYSQVGSTIGNLAKLAFLDDGGEMYGDSGAIFTRPTNVMLNANEAAVPLNYRAKAKTRPSMAMPLVNQIQKRQMYGGTQRA